MRPRSKRFRGSNKLPNPAEVAEMEIKQRETALKARLEHRHLIPTPTACNAPNTGGNTTGPKSLLDVARTGWMPGEVWRTPQASDWKNRGKTLEQITKRLKEGRQLGLAEQVRMLPTPTCQDAKNNGAPSQMVRNTKPLNAVVGGALNPDWVEWLMGWPIGWTDSRPLATARFLWWQLSHSLDFWVD
jgi:hypothetical protein